MTHSTEPHRTQSAWIQKPGTLCLVLAVTGTLSLMLHDDWITRFPAASWLLQYG